MDPTAGSGSVVISETFCDADTEDIVMVKANYWIGL